MKYIRIILGVVVILVLLVLPGIVRAQTITQGYDVETDVVIQKGMIVGLKKDDARKVESINNSQLDQLHGVVVGGTDASFVLAEDKQKIYVASGGKFEVLVSDQNGAISQGDYISLSPITGIGMKADQYQAIVLGKAIEVGHFDFCNFTNLCLCDISCFRSSIFSRAFLLSNSLQNQS